MYLDRRSAPQAKLGHPHLPRIGSLAIVVNLKPCCPVRRPPKTGRIYVPVARFAWLGHLWGKKIGSEGLRSWFLNRPPHPLVDIRPAKLVVPANAKTWQLLAFH
jgi:hypothetical protein